MAAQLSRAVVEPTSRAREAYVNDLGEEGEDRARSAYGENYPDWLP
jgi:hypothetical protein